jgi:hypothetical protein
MAGMIRDSERHYLNVNRNGYCRPTGSQPPAGVAIQAAGGAPACAAGDLPDRIVVGAPDRIAGSVPTTPPAALSLTAMAGVTCPRLVAFFTMHARRRVRQRKLRHF